jgi:predicted membrane protein
MRLATDKTDKEEADAGGPGLALLPLLTGLTLMLLMTVLPGLATDRQGQADHLAALLIFWAMSAGFVRGVGFIPRLRLPRLLLSGLSCALALLLALTRLAWLGQLPWLP